MLSSTRYGRDGCNQLPQHPQLCGTLLLLCALSARTAPNVVYARTSSCCCPQINLDAAFSPLLRQAGSGGSSSSIQEAAGQGDLATLQTLLSSGTAVDSRDDSGCTALHFAADRGQQEAVQALLAAGADVNAVDKDQQTPLHYAATCGHEEVSRSGF